MKNKSQLILLMVILGIIFLVAGCEKDGNIRIINRTSYPLYSDILAQRDTIQAGEELKVHISTGTQSFLDSSVGRYVEVFLQGETFQIWDSYEEEFVDKTDVWVNAGKTTNIYVDPNRACVKVVNNSGRNIKKIIVQRRTNSATQTMNYDMSPLLATGESWFKQQIPSTTQFLYAYIVQVVFENDDTYTYGNESNYLYKDNEFLVNVEPQDK